VSFINNRTVFNAIAASGTKIHVNTACMLSNLYLEIPLLSRDTFDF
jgi:hypothetical protein